nr:MAG TPA: hypothetical protein [Caudoviricetes sp.]
MILSMAAGRQHDAGIVVFAAEMIVDRIDRSLLIWS